MDFRLADWSLSFIFLTVCAQEATLYIWWWHTPAYPAERGRQPPCWLCKSSEFASSIKPSRRESSRRDMVSSSCVPLLVYFSSVLHRSQASVHIEQSSSGRVSLFVCFFCLLRRSPFCLEWVKVAPDVTTSARSDYTQETVGFTGQFLYSDSRLPHGELTEIKSCGLYKLMRSMSTE